MLSKDIRNSLCFPSGINRRASPLKVERYDFGRDVEYITVGVMIISVQLIGQIFGGGRVYQERAPDDQFDFRRFYDALRFQISLHL